MTRVPLLLVALGSSFLLAQQPVAPKKATPKKAAPAATKAVTEAKASPDPKKDPARIGLVPETPLVDLGKVATDKKVPFKIVLTNTADKPITLRTVAPACGCTTAMLPANRTAQPGEKLTIDLTFDPHGYWGKVSRNVDISTDAPEKPNFTVWVAAEVDAFCLPQPRVLLLAPNAGESVTQEFRFVPMNKGLEATSVTIQAEPDDKSALKVEWAAATGGEVKGTVTFAPAKGAAKLMPKEAHLLLTNKDGRTEYVKLVLEVR